MTNNLNGPRVAPGQTNKEQTINDSVGRIDAALTVFEAINPVTVYNVPLSLYRQTCGLLVDDSALTGTYEIRLPATVQRGLYLVHNAGAVSLAVGLVGGSTVAVAAGTSVILLAAPPTLLALT